MKPLTYSLLSAYQTCPRKCYHQQIAYTKFDVVEDREAADYGTEVHEAIDRAFRTGKQLEGPIKVFASIIDQIREYPCAQRFSEHHLGMYRSGERCDYKDLACWARGKLDLVLFGVKSSDGISRASAVLLDWKTGKRREDPLELEFHSMLLRANYPELTSIKGAYVWLKENTLGDLHDVFDTDYIKDLAIEIEEEIKMLWGIWPPKQNHLCYKYCPVITCEYNGKRCKNSSQKVS